MGKEKANTEKMKTLERRQQKHQIKKHLFRGGEKKTDNSRHIYIQGQILTSRYIQTDIKCTARRLLTLCL